MDDMAPNITLKKHASRWSSNAWLGKAAAFWPPEEGCDQIQIQVQKASNDITPRHIRADIHTNIWSYQAHHLKKFM